jgi:hypothetical protein
MDQESDDQADDGADHTSDDGANAGGKSYQARSVLPTAT